MRRLVALVLLLALFYAGVVEAALVNLSGELEVSYSWSRDDQDGRVIKKVTDFEQRYTLRNSGDLWDPRIGTFMLNGTFMNQEIQTHGESVDAQPLYNNLRLADYSGSVSLMPRLAPLTFSVQQLTQFNGAGSCYFFCSSGLTQKDRTTNYNLNWIVPIDHLPTVRVNLNQSDQKSSVGLFSMPPTNITTRFANVEISDRFREINVLTQYQFSQTQFQGQGTSNANAVNLNVDGRITEALSLTASGNYTNQGGLNTAQVNFIQQRGGNFALFYRPSSLWDSSLSYNMSESPAGNVDFKTQIAQGSLNLRPTTQVDIFSSYRFMRFESGVLTDSHFGTVGFNWRQLFGVFGLTQGASVSYSGTETAGTTNTTDMTGRYSINYTKGFDQYRLNAGYNISYDANRTTPTTPIPPFNCNNTCATSYLTGNPTGNPTHRDLLNSASAALENTDVRLYHWLVSYTFTDTHQDGNTLQPQDDQRAHVAQINVDSSYFKKLLLQASASLTSIEGFGTAGRTIQADLRANYFIWQGLSLSAEINHQDFPHGFFGDSDTFTTEAQWVNTIWQRLTLLFDVKEIYQLNESIGDRETFQGQSQFMYQWGKLFLTLSYLYVRDEGINTLPALNSQNFFVRAVRSF